MKSANFEYWDTVSEFHDREIGWLWCGLEPPGSSKSGEILPAMGYRILSAVRNGLATRELARMTQSSFSRIALRDWAETHSTFKPRFLFPPTTTGDLSLETALKVIAALARCADPRWQPGKRAPHGMVTKAVESAGTLDLQLDRNQIGKYLKIAGNKNISA